MGVILLRGLRLAAAGALVFALTLVAVVASEAAVRLGLLPAGPVATTAPLQPAPEAIVVFSSGGVVLRGGGRLQDARFELGLELKNANPEAKLALAGQDPGPNERAVVISFTDAARHVGLADDEIIAERASTTTFENIRFMLPLLEAREIDDVVLVTDPVHMPRTLALWMFFDGPKARFALARTELRFDTMPWAVRQVRYRLREAAAWWYNAYKAAAWWGLGLVGMSEQDRGRLIR